MIDYPFTAEEMQQASDEWGTTYMQIPGFPGYCAGDDGSIFSFRRGKRKQMRLWAASGYLVVRLCIGGKKSRRPVHILVMLAFHGTAPTGMEVAHENGNPLDARLSNLRYDTHKGNHSDRQRHGTNNAGEKNGQASMTKEKVIEARKRFTAGESKSVLMRDYEIGRRCLERILRRERWSHV